MCWTKTKTIYLACDSVGWKFRIGLRSEGSEFAKSCPTSRNPVDCSPPGSSIHGILQARRLSGTLKLVLEFVSSSSGNSNSRLFLALTTMHAKLSLLSLANLLASLGCAFKAIKKGKSVCARIKSVQSEQPG